MARRARVTTWYARQHGRILKPGSERSLAVARTVRTLLDADELPAASDFEASQRPVGKAWVRRCGARNLWLWFRFTAEELLLIALTTEPPVPEEPEDEKPKPA